MASSLGQTTQAEQRSGWALCLAKIVSTYCYWQGLITLFHSHIPIEM
jgi:hypothetical protein